MVEKFPVRGNKFIADFKEKSEIFNSFFTRQCLLIGNGSTVSSLFPLITDKSLSDADFSIEDIKTLSANLIQIKLMVTIRWIFACLNYVVNPFVNLLPLSSNLVWCKAFSHQNGKNQMSYQFSQKKGKQCVKNYRPVSLLPIRSKFFERIFITRCSHVL